jgi:hypothetical protein
LIKKNIPSAEKSSKCRRIPKKTDRDGEDPETTAAVCGEPGQAQMRSRSRDRAEQQARHHADPANDVGAEKSGSERDPESKQFRDRRNVGVGIIQALEQDAAWIDGLAQRLDVANQLARRVAGTTDPELAVEAVRGGAGRRHRLG